MKQRCVRIAVFIFASAAASSWAQWHRFGEGASPRELAAVMLRQHNEVRRRYHVEPPLRWSPELAQTAQRWATQLITSNSFQHEQHLRWGQNLFESIGGSIARTPSDVVSAWANEGSRFDMHSATCSGICGHFTQIVWHDTKEVGCAVAQNQSRSVWVCDYLPPGNVVGERPF